MHKNIYKNDFREARLLFETPETAPETTSAAPEFTPEKAEVTKGFLESLRGVFAKENPDSFLAKTPEKMLENEKLALILHNFISQNVPAGSVVQNFTHEKGTLVLHMDGGAPDVSLEGDVYYALFWPELHAVVHSHLADKGIPESVISGALHDEIPELSPILLALAHDVKRTPESVPEYLWSALISHLSTPESVRRSTEAELAKERSEIERKKLTADMVTKLKETTSLWSALPPGSEKLKNAETLTTSAEKAVQDAKIDKWASNIKRDAKDINAHNWKPYSSHDELVQMRFEWIQLGLPAAPGNPFYDRVFAQLTKSFDPQFLSGLGATPNIRDAYMNPMIEEHLVLLQAHDPGFARAWEYYRAVQKTFVNQDNNQILIGKSSEELKGGKWIDDISDGVKDNLRQFQKAVQQKDWATAAVYVGGVYALYKVYKMLDAKAGEGVTQGKSSWMSTLKSLGIIGIAAYATNQYFKNTGIDLGKSMNLKSEFSDVKGTSLAGLYNLDIPEAREVNDAVYLRASSLNFRKLHEHYEITNTKGIRFIDPAKFDNVFSEFTGFHPSQRAKDDGYRYVGEQLYMLVHVLSLAYEKTLMTDEDMPQYFNKGLAEVLTQLPYSASEVYHFTTIFEDYAPLNEKTNTYFESDLLKNAQARLFFVLAELNLSPDITHDFDRTHQAVSATMMGLPVIIVPEMGPNGKVSAYKILSRRDYQNDPDKIGTVPSLGSIPAEGDAKAAAGSLKTALEEEAAKLLHPLSTMGDSVLGKPHWNGTSWTVKVKAPAVLKYGLQDEPYDAIITFTHSGAILLHIDELSGTPYTIDAFMESSTVYGARIVRALIDKFPIFVPFYASGKISFVEDIQVPEGTAPQFLIRVAGTEVKVSYEKGTFVIAEEDQTRLLQEDADFVQEYAKLLLSDEQVKGGLHAVGTAIDQAPEQFHFYLFTGAWQWFSKATLDRPFRGVSTDFLSGTVPDNFSEALLAVKQTEAVYKVLQSIKTATTFEEATTIFARTAVTTARDLQDIARKFNEANLERNIGGQAWEREEYLYKVLQELNHAGYASDTYKAIVSDFDHQLVTSLNLAKTDLFEKPALIYAHFKSVFSYHTSYLDTASLDLISYPYEKGSDKSPNDKDPYHRIAYSKYVRETLIQEAQEVKGIESLKPPAAYPILSYQEWKKRLPSIEPYDEKDKKAALSNDAPRGEGISPLQGYLHKKIDDFQDSFIATRGDALKTEVFKDFLRKWKVDNVPAIAREIATKPPRFSIQNREADNMVLAIESIVINGDSFWEDIGLWERVVSYFD